MSVIFLQPLMSNIASARCESHIISGRILFDVRPFIQNHEIVLKEALAHEPCVVLRPKIPEVLGAPVEAIRTWMGENWQPTFIVFFDLPMIKPTTSKVNCYLILVVHVFLEDIANPEFKLEFRLRILHLLTFYSLKITA